MSNILQILASDPESSAWVSASAGTGKTKILTDRVLRLLISGARFDKILCLTFTNAAANEMLERINKKLANWAILEPSALALDIELTCGRPALASELLLAPTLYQKLLESHDKINIHTIHSFCQKILRKFPLEAGVNPGFQILDSIEEREALSLVKNSIYTNFSASSAQGSEAENKMLDFLVSNLHESTIDKIFDEILGYKIRFKKLFEEHGILPKWEFENQGENHSEEDSCFTKEEIFWLQNLHEIYPKLQKNKEPFPEYFLVTKGTKRQNIIKSKDAKTYPDLAVQLMEMQQRYYDFKQKQKIKLLYETSNIFIDLADQFIKLYEQYKTRKALLDYDDLIYYTQKLLSSSEAKEWVLYKLDGSIDHLLVDEAQDTSKEQWEIIGALIEEFYSGAGTDEGKNRTIFVVGDEKQSIFSFQGADIEYFSYMNNHLKTKLENANKNFQSITLEWSYRSTSKILNLVHRLFASIKQTSATHFKTENPKILPFRSNDSGKTELWPIYSNNEPENQRHQEESSEEDEDSDAAQSPAGKELAIKIAKFIRQQIDDKVIIPSTGEPAREKDFMILIRARSKFTLELINQLKIAGLEVCGLDRITLSENLAVQDLISAAKFVLSPYDNLNLACLLKSPIIGFTEEELQNLVFAAGSKPLFEKLKEIAHAGNSSSVIFLDATHKLDLLLAIYKNYSAEDFFYILCERYGLRKTLTAACDVDSEDAITEFLYCLSSYTKKTSYSLQNFIYWFEENKIEIKRDVTGSDKVRVMTAHGSKGLQAPIVILCDTTSMPKNKSRFVWTEDNRPLATVKSATGPEFFQELKEAQKHKELQEYLRLLYVALTRAEDHLIICGYNSKKQLAEYCWYNLAQKMALQEGRAQNIELEAIINKDDMITALSEANFAHTATEVTQEAKGANNSIVWRMPAHATEEFSVKGGDLVNSTNSSARADYIKYGIVFHKILEDTVKSRNMNNMPNHPLINTLPQFYQQKIQRAIKQLLKNQVLSEILSFPQLKTELNLGVNNQNIEKMGRIDLLAMSENKIIIIDYKSDSRPPETFAQIPDHYISQLNFYRHIIQNIYPNYEITCKILWLEDGRFSNLYF